MAISVYIDNNVWDFLFDRQIDLATALPSDEFCVCITREAEFEIPPVAEKNPELFRFITDTINRCVKTDVIFGFYNPAFAADQQRVGGFGQGRFVTQEESVFMAQQRTPLKQRHQTIRKKTGLYVEEADIAIGARALHSVVLSFDAKKGPINDACRNGGSVVFLTDFDASGLSLADYIKAKIK